MTYILLHKDVNKKLEKLPEEIEKRIKSKLKEASDNPKRHLKPIEE